MSKPADSKPIVERLDPSSLGEVVAVHCAAFRDYPTMRYLLEPPGGDYDERLATLIGLFVETVNLKGGVALGSREAGALVAAADTVRSDATEPPELATRREATWGRLGDGARSRYEAYKAATLDFEPGAPFFYLSMLGVRPDFSGRGLAKALLERVQALSLADPRSTGVFLETEDPANVSFYEHCGYRLTGHAEIGGGLEAWGFFRPDEG